MREKHDWGHIILWLWILCIQLQVLFYQFKNIEAQNALTNYLNLCYQVQEARLEQLQPTLDKDKESPLYQDTH